MSTPPVCPSCGAAGRPDSDRCDLCGTSFRESDALDERGAVPCLACAHLNPPGAAFCNQCGTAITAVETPAVTAPAPASSSAPGRRALVLIGAGLAVVVGLYALTLWSESRTPEPAPAESAELPAADPIPDGPTPPLPEANQAQVDELIAADTAEGWYEAGRFYLTAAFEVRETDPVRSAQWARRAVEVFENSLEKEPSADVQFALAEASQFDPATPMRPVLELRSLLESYPDHVGANLMMGERRLQIGRLDSARVSFEKVLALTQPGDPLRARAEEALAQVAVQTAS